jgi:hypothetical protein
MVPYAYVESRSYTIAPLEFFTFDYTDAAYAILLSCLCAGTGAAGFPNDLQRAQ